MIGTATADDKMMATYARWPVRFVEGAGATLTDAHGRHYVDFLAGIAVSSVGHSHPKVVEATARQAGRLIHVSNLYETGPQSELAERLFEVTGGMLSFFCNSGAESIECALKLARRWALDAKGDGCFEIIAAEGGFHGRTFGALAATGQPAKRAPFEPLPPGFKHVPYGDVSALERAVHDRVAGILLEPIQGEAGVVVPDDGYLTAVRELCDDRGCLLLLDEIQTGLGRTGKLFAHQHWGIRPDVMCLAKSLAGGLPIGDCLATTEVAGAFRAGDHASTFGGGPVQCAAALAVLDVIDEEGLVERAAALGPRLAADLQDIFGAAAVVRGKGMLIGVAFEHPVARAVASRALEAGLVVNDATPHVLRVAPPLVITSEEMERGLSILAAVWRQLEEGS